MFSHKKNKTLLKFVFTTILGLGLTMPIMAGSAVSQQMIASAKKNLKSISSKELKKMFDAEDDLFMLDVREKYQRIEGSIDGIENAAVTRSALEFDIQENIKDKNALVVVYCRSGKIAVLAAKTLVDDLHYTNVVYLEGGMDAWLEAGNSIYNNFGELQLVKD